MKKWYVYELVNLMGTVEYVGESTRPIQRFANHIKHSPKSNKSIGKFYKRQDIILNIVSEFNSKEEAYDYQCQLQKEYGLKTDREINGFHMKHSQETKNKMSSLKIGKSRPQWVKDKIRATMIAKSS